MQSLDHTNQANTTLICVYDMTKQGYRMLNINTLLTLSINKNNYKII